MSEDMIIHEPAEVIHDLNACICVPVRYGLAVVDSMNLDGANSFTDSSERASFYDGLVEDGLHTAKENGVQIIDKEVPALRLYGEEDQIKNALHELSRQIWETGEKIWFVMYPKNSQCNIMHIERERPRIAE